MRTALLLLLLPSAALAEAPTTMTHQGRLMDALGAPMDGAHTLNVALYDVPASGTALWNEDIDVTFDNGYFSVVLGETTAITPAIVDVSELYLGLAIDSGSELPARIEVTSVAYALNAGTADVAMEVIWEDRSTRPRSRSEEPRSSTPRATSTRATS